MNESHLNDLLGMDILTSFVNPKPSVLGLRLDDVKEKSLLGNEDILSLISIYTRKAIQYAYRETKTYEPRPCDYENAINVMKRYYRRVNKNNEIMLGM